VIDRYSSGRARQGTYRMSCFEGGLGQARSAFSLND
jgi:hypothetical protein